MAAIYPVNESFDRSLFDGASCTFGVFDGVHRGHAHLIDSACAGAKARGGRSIVLTFDIDPDEMFRPDGLRKLMSNEDRLRVLAQTGADAVCVFPFTESFASKAPEDFLDQAFAGHAPAQLHVGRDFRFGSKASGTTEDLMHWAQVSKTEVCAHDLVGEDGSPITATRIRNLLLAGRVESASDLLGRPYSMHDIVRLGRGDGADFGFKTANLEMPANLLVLDAGVYAGYAIVEGTPYRAAIAQGASPMFESTTTATCEVHILDFDQDIYGQDIVVEVHHRMRPMVAFASVDELIATVMRDIAWVRDNMVL